MKNFMRIAALALLLHANSGFAQCPELMSKIQGWIEAGGQVGVSTTFSGQDASIAISYGNLEADVTRPGVFTSQSVRSKFKNPEDTESSLLSLEVMRTGETSVQLNYKINNDVQQSTAYLMTCNRDMMYIHASDGILTAMFQIVR